MTPPKHLQVAGRRLWRSVTSEYDVAGPDLVVLQAACEAADRVTEAREAITRDGPYVEGRFGIRAHPALGIERDSRIAMLRALRELGLEAPAAETGGVRRGQSSSTSFPRRRTRA